MTIFGRRVLPWAVVVAVAAVTALALIVLLVDRGGGDRTLVGTTTSVELHRLCVDPLDAAHVCVRVDSPVTIRDVHAGDCIRMRYSAQHILVTVEQAPEACP